MMKILITGGTGFVGQHLVEQLCLHGDHSIKILCRNEPATLYHDITKNKNVTLYTQCDITKPESINHHFKDIDVVFHLAGCVSFRRKDRNKIMDINHSGTKNVLASCKENCISKLIHVSSTAALGFHEGSEMIDEKFHFDWNKKAQRNAYSYSKYLAEKVVFLNTQVPSIILNPPLIIGPGDRSLSPRIIGAIKQGRIPFNPPGINSIVDVRDVASALVFLMQRGVVGEKYILHSASLSFKEFNNLIAQKLGSKAPRSVLPKITYGPLRFIAWCAETFQKNPRIFSENIYFAFKQRMHSSQKILDLGFTLNYTSEQTISDTISFLKVARLLD